MEIITLDKDPAVNLHFALHTSKEDKVLGVIQISHGMAEHMGRYEHFINHLNINGFHVIIHDHRGHGRRIIDGRIGFFGASDGWQLQVKDLMDINSKSISMYPELPQFLLGHSMGSWISMSALQEGANFDGLILSGSSKPNFFETVLQKLLLKYETLRLGSNGYSTFLHKIIFGGFNSNFLNTKTPNDWLSRDEESVKNYTKDPLCGFIVSNQLWADVIQGIEILFKPDQLGLIPKDIPILIFSGAEDPVGGMGRGTTLLHQLLIDCGCKSSLYLIEGARHETLNETDKINTYNYIIKFLNNFLARD